MYLIKLIFTPLFSFSFYFKFFCHSTISITLFFIKIKKFSIEFVEDNKVFKQTYEDMGMFECLICLINTIFLMIVISTVILFFPYVMLSLFKFYNISIFKGSKIVFSFKWFELNVVITVVYSSFLFMVLTIYYLYIMVLYLYIFSIKSYNYVLRIFHIFLTRKL